MTDTTLALEALTRRVQVLEDERAIERTLVRYGFAVDSNDAEALVALSTDDTVIEIDGTPLFHGSGGATNGRSRCRQSFAVGTPGAQDVLHSGL